MKISFSSHAKKKNLLHMLEKNLHVNATSHSIIKKITKNWIVYLLLYCAHIITVCQFAVVCYFDHLVGNIYYLKARKKQPLCIINMLLQINKEDKILKIEIMLLYSMSCNR
jgi:hypothetical protein